MSEYKPFDKGYLQVDEIHKIYYEQYGQKDGIPGNFDCPPKASCRADFLGQQEY